MSDLLGIGSSALLAYRQALDVTGHNIANANTAGYVRQSVELQARPGTAGGVIASSVTRSTDQILGTRVLGDTSSFSRLDVFSTLATNLDAMLSDADAGLARPLQDFFSALANLASSPNSVAARQVVLGKAQTLVARFAELQQQLDDQASDIGTRLTQTVGEINNYSHSVASLNERIALASANGQTPNDLLDQRDQLVNEIASRVGISTVRQADGTLNLYLGSGQALVLGSQSYTLGTAADRYGGGTPDITYGSGAGSVVLTSQLSGGSIGGLLDYRREILDPALNQLGRLAAGLSESVNAQHALGMDAYGQLGGLFFETLNPQGIAASSNTGTAAVSLSFSDVSQLGSDDYLLRYDGSAWSLSSRSSGQAVALGGSGSVADPFVAAGLSFTVSGTAAAGDQFLLQPTHSAAGELALAFSDPQRLAAASPLGGSAALANTGSASLGTVSVLDAADPALLAPVTLQFTSASTYSINGSGSYSYTPGADIDLNGWRVQINGTPASGDQFQIGANSANSSSNDNVRALAGLASRGVLDGGQTGLLAAHTALVTRVGTQAQGAQLSRDAAHAIQRQTLAQLDSIAGVNLDQEAADLVRWQQAYQAAAQLIATANTLFDSLLNATRR